MKLLEAPIDHISYSAMSQLMRNALAFKKTYILKVYDNMSSPSSVIGSAGHKALEEYYKGMSADQAIAEGLRYIKNNASTVDWGKTGSLQKANEIYTQGINWYFEEMPTYHKILGVEMAIVAEMEKVDGTGALPLPGKGKFDLITENKLGEIEVIDHKFVRSHSDGDVDVFSHFLQGMFAYHLVKAEFGRPPARIIFNELKLTKNSKENTGKPQLQPYTIEFNGQGIYGDFATFYNLFKACYEFISREDAIYLPNPSDIFDGQASFESYRMGVIGVEQVVGVKHKTEQKQFVEKNYVPSAFDKVGNEAFTPEAKIEAKLVEFGIGVEMQETVTGPSVIRYTMKPNRGVPMSKFAKLGDDLALALEAKKVRIDAPIRGTSLVGVEVANPNRQTVELGENHFKRGTTMIPIGVDVNGQTTYCDLVDMPHLLIAGQTGSGKSVMLNVILESLTTQMKPSDLKLLLIDPKEVELSMFEDAKHLLAPIVTESAEAVDKLEEMVLLMNTRYKTLREHRVRNIADFNKIKGVKKMPKIVVVVDEFADLMMSGGKTKEKAQFAEITERDFAGKPIRKYKEKISDERPSVEENIVRIAQKARAVGIHLIIATQRPSADVVTGLIKANIPTKIAFSVTNEINSKIILDEKGAEELTGKGDMLFVDPSTNEITRLQGLYA